MCPQDYARNQIVELIRETKANRLTELYRRARVCIGDQRVDVPREIPFVPPFNKWMANVVGTTYFLPVAELSALYINLMLSPFERDFAFFFVDDHNSYQPAGVSHFARAAGGHLEKDPTRGRVVTISFMEAWVCEFVAADLGAILQKLGLMSAALGLGGFPHFAAHPFIWSVALGFRIENVPFHRPIGAPAGAASDYAGTNSNRPRAQWPDSNQAVLPAVLS